MLTANDAKKMFSYDPETGLLKWKIKKSIGINIGDVAGTVARQGKRAYIYIGVGGMVLKAHRIIMLMMTGNWPPAQVDHINGSGLDNRWCNLRFATNSENARNRKIPTTNKSGRIGVRWYEDKKRWTAYITHNKKLIHLGSFKDKNDAVAARSAAEKELGFHPNHGSTR